ncbi:type I restriction endonuclease subunit R, partial [Vibrio anguillarum]|nr:type I restriction endonuclease subunit R [Vibrio anguillarum]
ERLFKKKNLSEVTQDEMVANIDALNKIHQRVKELNRQNNQLRQKYLGDTKYARLHKRLYERQQERRDITDSERKIFEALLGVKEDADNQVLDNTSVLDNESYFERHLLPKVYNRFIKQQSIPLNAEAVRYVNHLVVAEYLKEFNTGSQSW